MKYHKSASKPPIYLKDIPSGELFEYSGEIYMKVELSNIKQDVYCSNPPIIKTSVVVLLENGWCSVLPDAQQVKSVSYKPLEIE